MKRALFETTKILPGRAGETIDRSGFLSAIFAVTAGEIKGAPTSAALTITVTHCDTSTGTFIPLADGEVGLGNPLTIALLAGVTVNIPLDLAGCKNFVKFTPAFHFEGGTNPTATATYAVALGDSEGGILGAYSDPCA